MADYEYCNAIEVDRLAFGLSDRGIGLFGNRGIVLGYLVNLSHGSRSVSSRTRPLVASAVDLLDQNAILVDAV